ncbi:hypothetical protein [Paenibacillus alba]|uniref:YfhD family protein n=1 Tax=Paenibacillus alba TaxID=1197127 RepID=A0ABU6G2H9_9BACL|nr:hypothetical protein [Paenibacillus alba]MEC0228367.1 hypothetical protein [Paenibacillus alba]
MKLSWRQSDASMASMERALSQRKRRSQEDDSSKPALEPAEKAGSTREEGSSTANVG